MAKNKKKTVVPESFIEMVAKILGYPGVGTDWRDFKGDSLEVKWTMGGLEGGNCWGDAADLSISPESEPDFEQLDKILEVLCPSITYLQYKALVKELVESTTQQESAYYGNYYVHGVKSIKLAALEEFLKENGLWQQKAR